MGVITRKRGVFYKDGRPVSENEQERCRKLGIPPAYTNVKVHAKNAKLQATALDAKGKKHYYYHEKYLAQQRKKKKNSSVTDRFREN
jgi:DNA topoisomerase IB